MAGAGHRHRSRGCSPEHVPNLLITDISLPDGIYGHQVAEQARQLRPELKTRLISGYAEQALQAGSGAQPEHLLRGKPFTLDALPSRGQTLLDAD